MKIFASGLFAILLTFLFLVSGAVPSAAKPAQAGLTVAETILVDDNATGYATFQSHNQKVVSNRNGIFMTHIRTRNEPYTAQQWRLSRSTDGGTTFSTVYEITQATSAPCMETDEADNLYLIRPDFNDGNAYLYRFLAEKNYTEPLITTISGGSSGKYSMAIDLKNRQIYYFAGNYLFVLTLDGKLKRKAQFLKGGDNAYLMYPLLSLAPDGVLHTAWTNQKSDEYLYWDIHYMATPDSGSIWRKFDGSTVSIPAKSDDSGPTDRISLADENGFHNWLSGFMEKEGKLHFIYTSQTSPVNRQHYIRYDIETGNRDIDTYPDFKGSSLTIRSFDGFFASRSDVANAPLYCIANVGGKIGCLASDDNGTTWYDYALSEQAFNPYSIGGCREITGGGGNAIIGSFTDQRDPVKVYFIRIKAGLSTARVLKSSYDGGSFSAEFTNVHGQPESIRFSADKMTWGDWQPFSTVLKENLAAEPQFFQLKSRMQVESDVFTVAGAVPKAMWTTFNKTNVLGDDAILGVNALDDGSVWVSTLNGGASRFDGVSWKTFTTADNLQSDYIYTVARAGDGMIWAGTYGYGAARYDGSEWTQYRPSADGLADGYVYSIKTALDGSLWFGSHYQGVSRFDGTTWMKYSTDNGLASNTVYRIAAGKDGSMWFATGDKGVCRFDGSTWKTYTTADGIPSNSPSAIAVSEDGSVWTAGYGQGAARFDGEKWTKFTASAGGLLTDYVTCIAAAPDGAMWFGAWGGACRFDGTNWKSYTSADGLADNWVTTIAVERDGAVWFGTNNAGVSRFYGFQTRVEDAVSTPSALRIFGNYPNPFNPSTTIEFRLPRETAVTVSVYSITGQRVRTLIAERLPSGVHSLRWDGRDDSGRSVSSGVYLAEVRADKARAAHRMTLLR